MKTRRDLFRSEDGMEALEGLLVYTLTLFVLFFIWAFGFLLYQNWAVQYVATDTATRIAQTYAYDYADPITGFISTAASAQLSPYRYDEDLKEINANRAGKYAEYCLKNTGFSKSRGMQISVKSVTDSIAQRHIEVTVTATYEIPFGFAMRLFGQSPYRQFSATGRAGCVDIKNYIYTIKTINTFGSVIGKGFDSDLVKTIEKSISLIKSGAKWMESLKNHGGNGGGSTGGGIR